jgi:hypothetical protein
MMEHEPPPHPGTVFRLALLGALFWVIGFCLFSLVG